MTGVGAVMVITLNRADSTAELRKTRWSAVVPIGDLPRWLTLYQGLRDRSPKKGGGTPWAGFYAEDVRVLERAVTEAGLDGR